MIHLALEPQRGSVQMQVKSFTCAAMAASRQRRLLTDWVRIQS
ncbi:MAG: hypothetical protein SF187_04440 [Deltaproteobacteria bacterium]|nr:hypothetical protein [Deltaproteobacteria bacterium]